MSRLHRAYTNVAAVKAQERYWSVAVDGSLHDARRPSDHLPLLLRVSSWRARMARLPRIPSELVATYAFREFFGHLSRGLERCEVQWLR